MTGEMVGSFVSWLIVAILVIVVAAYLLHWLYYRSNREMAFVRTGFGGEKVVINSGAFVLPIIHEVIQVNLNVVRIPVSKTRQNAVISRDRMRVDVEVEFFVRVVQRPESVSAAASTLGRRTTDPEQLTELLSGKFVGALRSAASEMTLDEMHEKREDMQKRLEERAKASLAQNGLELESVAITDLNQTDLEFFNPTNRFDAEGMTDLIETIETRRKLRNDIEQSSMVAIRARNLEAEKEALKLEQESESSRLEQEREIEAMRAEQKASVQKARVARQAEADQARIETEHATREKEIERRSTLEATEIAAREEVEKKRIANERDIQEARIEKERELRRLEVERETVLELAEIERQIQILKKQAAEQSARIDSETARAKAVRAEEQVNTSREREIAERMASIDRLVARKDAEVKTIGAEADKVAAAIEIEAQRLRYEAENILSDSARAGLLRDKLIERLEGIIRESAKPMEQIDAIKILHVNGIGNTGNTGKPTPTDEVIDSILRYRAQAPLIDEMMKEVGIQDPNVSKNMGDIFRAAKDAKSLVRPASDGSAAPTGDGGAVSAGREDSAPASDGGSVGRTDETNGVDGPGGADESGGTGGTGADKPSKE